MRCKSRLDPSRDGTLPSRRLVARLRRFPHSDKNDHPSFTLTFREKETVLKVPPVFQRSISREGRDDRATLCAREYFSRRERTHNPRERARATDARAEKTRMMDDDQSSSQSWSHLRRPTRSLESNRIDDDGSLWHPFHLWSPSPRNGVLLTPRCDEAAPARVLVAGLLRPFRQSKSILRKGISRDTARKHLSICRTFQRSVGRSRLFSNNVADRTLCFVSHLWPKHQRNSTKS